MKLNIKDQWKFFLSIVFNPWVLITGIISFILLKLPTSGNSTLQVLTNIFLWLTSAIFGGIVSKLWMDHMEEKVIVTRGKAAVRNLKLLLNNIHGFEKRVIFFKKKIEVEEQSNKIFIAYLEEINDRCNLLQEEVLNSIENWTDIIPNANVQTQIGIITSIKGEKETLENDIHKLNQTLEENRGKTEEEKKLLEKQLREKNLELDRVKRELREKEYKVAGTIISGNYSTTGEIKVNPEFNLPSFKFSICSSCKKSYIPSFLGLDNGKCDDCNSNKIRIEGMS